MKKKVGDKRVRAVVRDERVQAGEPRTINIDVRDPYGIVPTVTVNPDAVEFATRIIFGPRPIASDETPPHADAARDALKNWAATFVAKDALRYFLNADLRELLRIAIQTALFISIRRGLEKLPDRMPTGDHGLRNDDEREQWQAFAGEWGKSYSTRNAIVAGMVARLEKHLGAGWQYKPGNKAGSMRKLSTSDQRALAIMDEFPAAFTADKDARDAETMALRRIQGEVGGDWLTSSEPRKKLKRLRDRRLRLQAAEYDD